MDGNYEFYMKADLSPYVGKWIAISNDEIVSSGKDPKKVLREAKKKYPHSQPLLARVPEKEAMIF